MQRATIIDGIPSKIPCADKQNGKGGRLSGGDGCCGTVMYSTRDFATVSCSRSQMEDYIYIYI